MPTKKPRRLSAAGRSPAAASSRLGRGGTVCGLAGPWPAWPWRRVRRPLRRRVSLAFLAAAWRAASARSRGSVIFSSGGSTRAAAVLAAAAAAPWRRPAWPRPELRPPVRRRPARPPAFPPASSAGPAAWPAPARPSALRQPRLPRPARPRRRSAFGSRSRGGAWVRPPRRAGAPPARAAASFSFSVSGRPSDDGVGTFAAGAAGAPPRLRAPLPAAATLFCSTRLGSGLVRGRRSLVGGLGRPTFRALPPGSL